MYEFPEHAVFQLSRYADARAASRDWEVFSSERPWLTASTDTEVRAALAAGWPERDVLAGQDPPAHTTYRELPVAGTAGFARSHARRRDRRSDASFRSLRPTALMCGQPGRGGVRAAGRVRRHAQAEPTRCLRLGASFLRRSAAYAPRRRRDEGGRVGPSTQSADLAGAGCSSTSRTPLMRILDHLLLEWVPTTAPDVTSQAPSADSRSRCRTMPTDCHGRCGGLDS